MTCPYEAEINIPPDKHELNLLLSLGDAHSRIQAANQIKAAGKDISQPCSSFLAERIGDDRRAAAMLELMGEDGTAALADRLGGNADGLAQRMAMESLAAMGPAGAAALDLALRSRDAVACRNAAEALAWMDELGIEKLVPCLEHYSVDVRLCAIWALSRSSTVTLKDALALARLMQDSATGSNTQGSDEPGLEVRDYAVQALVYLGEVGAQALAEQLMPNKRADVQELAKEALACMGVVGANAAFALMGNDRPAEVRKKAALVLVRLGEDGAQVLGAMLFSEDAGIRRRCVEALAQMDSKLVKPYMRALQSMLREDHDSYVRVSVARLLLNFEGVSEAIRTAAADVIKDAQAAPPVHLVGERKPKDAWHHSRR
eukprot:TRINITY_DN9984_c0_g1_i1.p1 TRINITY_DN9984_c0_g1~~TRINITY_DN9984_c0_g1_i1.p1  ORF type:complete len:374 (-),score=84.77 TRINITY_DN9984_c0_g1_i1:212-1333(-)